MGIPTQTVGLLYVREAEYASVLIIFEKDVSESMAQGRRSRWVRLPQLLGSRHGKVPQCPSPIRYHFFCQRVANDFHAIVLFEKDDVVVVEGGREREGCNRKTTREI